MNTLTENSTAGEKARFIQSQTPKNGLFDALTWRVSPKPFFLGTALAAELDSLGRVLLQFNRVANLLYRQSVAGKMPSWISDWLDLGKPSWLVELQRSSTFKNDVPRVIRPDLILEDTGFAISELDSVPGGIGLTAWLNRTYSRVPGSGTLLGGENGMVTGFCSIFPSDAPVHIVISEEASTYRPEMEWVCSQLGDRFKVRDSQYDAFQPGDSVYRFFELFDIPQVSNANLIFQKAAEKSIRLTPPPKPLFEEKMLLALLWNRNLQDFWRRELGERFFKKMLEIVPQTWVVDPAPLPPHAAIPGLEITDWAQLKTLSQRDRQLILKISGFSEKAWGARGVFLGSDLSTPDWSQAVDEAIRSFPQSPYILQRYRKPRLVDVEWYDFDTNQVVPMPGRVRLCPYYFVHGEGDAARTSLGGALATICPADKKIIHGMSDAVLAPAAV